MVPIFLPPVFRPDGLAGCACAIFALAIGGWVPSLAAPAQGQDVQRIAAIVNDEIISRYDVQQRVDLVISTSRLSNTPDARRRLRRQILRSLIDERLQLQAAKRHSIKVGKADLKRAFRFIENQNKLPVGGLDRYLTDQGVPREALEAQLRAEISWTKLVRRRLSRNVQIGEEEIDKVLARLQANAGRSEFRISEISLPVDTPEQEDEVRRASFDLIKQLRRGATFAAMARQFSSGPSATQGGAVGWVRPGQLASNLDQAIAKMKSGELSEPIRAAGGYYIIQLHERRPIASKSKNTVKLQLKQILFPMVAGSAEADIEANEALARMAGGSAKSCAEVEAVAKELPSAGANDLGTVTLADLPPNIAAAVKDLAIDRFSAPIRNSAGVMILMVCEREEFRSEGPNRQTIADNLARRRLSMLAQRFLRDLRRSAVVELR